MGEREQIHEQTDEDTATRSSLVPGVQGRRASWSEQAAATVEPSRASGGCCAAAAAIDGTVRVMRIGRWEADQIDPSKLSTRTKAAQNP